MKTVKHKRNLKVLFVINLASSLCISTVNPLFPLFVKDLGATVTEISSVLFISGLIATMVIFPSGLLSDRYRRRNILIASSSISGLALFSLTLIGSWEQSIPGIVLFTSAFWLSMPASISLIADNTESTSMATTFAYMNIAWPIGFIVGPFISGLIADNFGWSYVFYLAASVSFASVFPCLFFQRTYKGDKRIDKERIKGSFFRREIILFLVVFSLFHVLGTGARGIINLTIPIYLTEVFRVSKTMVGLFLSMGFGLAVLIAQIPSGMLADRYGCKKILVYCTFPLSFIALILPSVNNFFILLIYYMLIAGLWSMTWPASAAYLMELTPTLERGTTISIRQTAVRFGFTVGPMIGGYLWDVFSPTTPFYGSAILFALAFLLILYTYKIV